jgi:hypothetical protein
MTLAAGAELVRGPIEVACQQHRLEQLHSEFSFMTERSSGGDFALIGDNGPESVDEQPDPLERHGSRIHEVSVTETFA